MTITNGYCTLEELKIELKRQNEASTHTQNTLEQAINRASRYIDSVTGRVFYSVNLVNEKVDIYDFSENGLYINSNIAEAIEFPAPIISIESITVDGDSLTVNEDYYIYKDRIARDGSLWTSDPQGIVVNGIMGYAETPSDINNICLAIASAICGLSASILNTEDGDQIAVIKNSLPAWVNYELKSKKRRFIC